MADTDFPADAPDFLADFAEMSSFGATAGGGVERLAGSTEHAAVRTWFREQLRRHGLEPHTDAIGNLFGLAELTPGAPYVLLGSHLDSQPRAGKYDGAYGVLAALHAAAAVVRSHRSAGTRPTYNIAVVDWFNEEGARFKPSMMGSGVVTGKLPLDRALATLDSRGTSVGDALASHGFAGEFEVPELAAYGEIHIEQGPSMERARTTIGAVAATWCAFKYEIVVHGEQGHTGSAPMASRRDALLAGAHVVTAVNDLVTEAPAEALHTSVGEFTVLPNSPVTIAREVRMLVDLRAESSDLLDAAFERLQVRLAEIERRTRTRIEIASRSIWTSGPFWEPGVDLVERISAELALPHGRVKTLAGHDATNVKDIAPTILVFVPSVDGLSHNEREYTRDADLLAGLRVFERIARELTDGAIVGERDG